MIAGKDYRRIQKLALEILKKTGLPIGDMEQHCLEVVDFGLGNADVEGAQILTLLNTDRLSVKIIVLLPHQTLPEHRHPPVGDDPGKEETVRVITGTFYLYVPGEDNIAANAPPPGKEKYYSARHQAILLAGGQATIAPGVLHWFKAGDEGAVVFSFSTHAMDLLDQFTDPSVIRTVHIVH